MIKIVNCSRPNLIGDHIVSLICPTYLENHYPKSIKIGLLDSACRELAPLLINAPNLDGFHLTEYPGIISKNDEEYFKKFDLVFEPFCPITDDNWFNKMNLVEQTFKMNFLRGKGRINPAEWDKIPKEDRYPKLSQWFDFEKQDKCIAIWGQSGYSNDIANQKRNPSSQYWVGLVERLKQEGYRTAQLGIKSHGLIDGIDLDLRHLSLFDAIKFSLGAKISIQTDSGSAHIIGAYGSNQILLTTYWRTGHFQNENALIPVNWKNRAINLFHPTCINTISYDKIMEGIKNLNE